MLVVDLSHHQRVTNYDSLRNAADAFYMKLTQSTAHVDTKWQQHYRGLQGKPRAPYHFMGRRESWRDQVAHFLSQANKVPWEWPHVLDAEFDANQQTGDPNSEDIRGWIAEWRRQTGRRLIYVYIGRNTWKTVAPPNEWADRDTRIIGARYLRNNFNTAFLDFGFDHPNLDGVQYWHQGSLPGIEGFVDLNNFRRLITDNSQEEDLNPQQIAELFNRLIFLEQAVRTLVNQATGDPEGDPSFNKDMRWQDGNFPGFESLVDPNVKRSPVDFGRYTHKHVNEILDRVKALETGGVDVNALAEALKPALASMIVEELSKYKLSKID